MSTIRRVLSGISSSISRARLDVDTEVKPLTPREPLQPVEHVRRGFSDESEFQTEVDDLDTSLAAHAPSLAGASGASASGASPEQLRVFSGESSFESGGTRSRYAQLLGSQLPASLGAPQERSGGAASLSGARGRDVGGADMDDLMSPETAAWELQNLDTSTPSVVEPEDLLFMLDPPGSSGPADPVLELGLDDDVFENAPAGLSGVSNALRPQDVAALDDAALDDASLDPAVQPAGPDEFLADTSDLAEELDPAVRPAGPEEFLADTDDLGSMVPEDEPSVSDAALAGVLTPLLVNPAAASAPVAAALASQAVEAIADTFEVAPAAEATVNLNTPTASGEQATTPTSFTPEG
ncbi:hypothetical protein JY651_31470 [Pyxidicoccus parkwayensis]|uniref:Uncharacterized protein n=1 Tax=Pyxidicoccus parkwayensis TaxID=2813578 RepID=A0ABX7NMY0_9BACT|nr:hypothetical protein [Pyxidicoccus parkwaysis]QSQ19791.1 hypothetical protein JY651_31470 [Pyxidicoccus parkwaysis]